METEFDESKRAFGAPWEAQVFALVLTLQRRGLFTWAEWSTVLASVVKPVENPTQQIQHPQMSDSHYGHWLAALEKMVVSKGVGNARELSTLYENWDRAARATPHGEPIELGTD